MPVVTIDMVEGRSITQKKQLVEGITNEFVKIGTDPEKVTIIIREVAKHNLATGGKLNSESLLRPL